MYGAMSNIGNDGIELAFRAPTSFGRKLTKIIFVKFISNAEEERMFCERSKYAASAVGYLQFCTYYANIFAAYGLFLSSSLAFSRAMSK